MLAKAIGNSITEPAPMIGQELQPPTHAKPILNGVRLPTRTGGIILEDSQSDESDEEISKEDILYLNYMKLGQYPQGPFFEESKTTDQHKDIDLLIERLIHREQFTALNELLQECDPLYRLNLYAHKFSPHLFSEFIRTVDETQPRLRQLFFVVPMSIGLPTFFEDKADSIIDLIKKNHQLEKFNILGIDDVFSPKILYAIGKIGNLKAINFNLRPNTTDTIGDSLCDMIRRCTQLQSICLKGPRFSEQKSAEIFQALRKCQQLSDISFSNWHFKSLETCHEFSKLIEYSSTLKSFSCDDWFAQTGQEPASSHTQRLSSFSDGLSRNASLKSLSLGHFFSWDPMNSVPAMVSVLKQHPSIEQLTIPGCEEDSETSLMRLTLLADLLEHNHNIRQIIGLVGGSTSLSRAVDLSATTFETQYDSTIKLIEDRLARNRAIASGEIARIFCTAFFPSTGGLVGSNHIGDPGVYLTEHILRQSPNLPKFEQTMVEIALSIDETAKSESLEPQRM